MPDKPLKKKYPVMQFASWKRCYDWANSLNFRHKQFSAETG